MPRDSAWKSYIHSMSAAIISLLLILNLITPATGSEQVLAHSRAKLDTMLDTACGGCHTLNRVILETGKWNQKDWTNAFDEMAIPRSGLACAERKAVANYLGSRRQSMNLEGCGIQDAPKNVGVDTYYVLFENRCLVCHDTGMIERLPQDLSRKDLRHTVDRMVEKAPEFLDGINRENVVEYLEKFGAARGKVTGKAHAE